MRKLDMESLEYFTFGNISSGSDGKFNFKIIPGKETMTAKIWYGIYCIEKSEIAAQQEFTLDEAGYQELCSWIDQQQKEYYHR